MRIDLLQIYMNDHLAGATLALQMIRDFLNGREEQQDLFTVTMREMLEEIELDERALRDIIARLGGAESGTKQTGAWLAEKFAQLKLGIGSDEKAGLRVFEHFEVLMLGVRGKLALWETLHDVIGQHADLQGVDLPLLQRRAKQQYERLDQVRREAARRAFLDT